MEYKTNYDLINGVFLREITNIDLIEFFHSNYHVDGNTVFNLKDEIFRFVIKKEYELGIGNNSERQVMFRQNFMELEFFIRYLNVLLIRLKSELGLKDYFIKPVSEEQLNFLKKTSKHKSKDIAIIMVLLQQYKYISIPSQGNAGFLRIWYDFLDRPHPSKDNFHRVLDYVDLTKNPVEFKNPKDINFKRMKKLFEEFFINL